MTARVTVFCPIYNDGRYLPDLIPSVLSQTFEDFEFLILENGSTDNTRALLAQYSDPRIRIVRSHINLKSETSTRLLRDVESEFIAPIYADDEFLPQKLEVSIKALEGSSADACFSNTAFMDEIKQPVPRTAVPRSMFSGDISLMNRCEHLHYFARTGNSLHPVSMVIRSQALKDLKGFRGDMHQVGDMDFFARLLLRKKVLFLEDELQRIRIRSGGRNESTINDVATNRIRGERINFFNNYRSPEALAIIDQIFLPDPRGISVPKDLRLWFLGQQFVRHYEPDCRFFGMSCLYDALRDNGDTIESALTASLGMPPGAYIDQLAPTIFSDFGSRDAAKDAEIGRLAGEVLSLRAAAEAASLAAQEREDRLVAIGSENSRLRRNVEESYARIAEHEEAKERTVGDVRSPSSLEKANGGERTGTATALLPVLGFDEVVDLSQQDGDPYVDDGFSYPESWGRWTAADRATIRFRFRGKPEPAVLRLLPYWVFEPAMAGKKLGLSLNGNPPTWLDVQPGIPVELELPERVLRRSRDMHVTLHIKTPKCPDEGPLADTRMLGVGLSQFCLVRPHHDMRRTS